MANRFWVGGTGTWDASDTTHWAGTSNGAGGVAVPVAGDVVTFDGSSGGGTVTVSHASLSIATLTIGAFTGTLDFATNNNNITLGTLSMSGTGTRTLNMGDGTWTVTSGAAGAAWAAGTITNLTFNCNGSTLDFASTQTGYRGIDLGALTYNNVAITNATAVGFVNALIGNATIGGTLTFVNTNMVTLNQGLNMTVTGAITWTNSANSPAVLHSTGTVATLTVAATNTLTGVAIGCITKAGAGSITVTDGYDLGNNTNITINNPAGGGGVVARVIGG